MPWSGTSHQSINFRSNGGMRHSPSIFLRYSIRSGWRFRRCGNVVGGELSMLRRPTASLRSPTALIMYDKDRSTWSHAHGRTRDAGEDITCNAVATATLPTPSIEAKILRIAEDQGISVDAATRGYLAERQPGGRFVSLEAVAALTGFLCGPNSRDINGAAIPMDCGWTAS